MKKISIFGSTGEIGSKMVNFVIDNRDQFDVMCLACGSNYNSIISQANILRPRYVVVSDKNAYEIVKNKLKMTVLPAEALNEVAMMDVDIMGMAISGMAGILPSFYCLGHAKTLAIANKETIVAGGKFFINTAHNTGTEIIPIDSEHSAIYQCLVGEDRSDIEEVILTCSGGPFIDLSEDELKMVTVEQALCHPKWKMGRKNTIDSATVMNKALEILEAAFLFNIDIDKIRAIIHRQSIIHGFVSFRDSSIKALLSYPDMTIPISYALNGAKRCLQKDFKLDLNTSLFFEPIKSWQKKSLDFAYRAYKEDKNIVLNTINEKCVLDFLDGNIAFSDIQTIIEKTLDSSIQKYEVSSISDVVAAIKLAKQECLYEKY